jgi:hypothetical protein
MRGSFSMKTHGRIPYTVAQPHTVTTRRSPGAHRANPAARTAGGILILTLVVGGASAVTAESLGHGNADHASGHQSASPVHIVRPVHKPGGLIGVGVTAPWMY